MAGVIGGISGTMVTRLLSKLVPLLAGAYLASRQPPEVASFPGPFPSVNQTGKEVEHRGEGWAVGVVTTCEGHPLPGAQLLELGSRRGVLSNPGFVLGPRAPSTYLYLVRAIAFLPETLSWMPRPGRIDTLQPALRAVDPPDCECISVHGRPIVPCACQRPRCSQPAAR